VLIAELIEAAKWSAAIAELKQDECSRCPEAKIKIKRREACFTNSYNLGCGATEERNEADE